MMFYCSALYRDQPEPPFEAPFGFQRNAVGIKTVGLIWQNNPTQSSPAYEISHADLWSDALAREPLAYVDELETDALKKSTAWWR